MRARHAARTLPATLLLLGLFACEGSDRPPDIVLISWDTVRWDHVGPDADGRSATPRFDRLAAEGVVFEEARSPAAITLPAHATLLTGWFPQRHGARDNGVFAVRAEAPRLAARVQAKGYRTGAFVSAAVLAARFGLAEGFERYDEATNTKSSLAAVGERRGDRTTDAAVEWLSALPAESPLFLWLHIYDPHRQWDAPAPHADRHDPYRAEIAFTDAQTGRLLDALERSGRSRRSIVVVTADHGEGLGEHGESSHSYFAYDSTLRVPLLFWAGDAIEGLLGRGLRVPGPASLADVAPTLAEIVGLDEVGSDGRSLAANLRGEAVAPRLLPFESVVPALDFGAAPVFGLLDAQGHSWFDGPLRERYDTRSDPEQRRNLYSEADADRAAALFARQPRDWPPGQTPLALDAAERLQLEALGYLSEPHDDTRYDVATDSVDAKQRIELFDFLMTGHQALEPRDALHRARELEARHGALPALSRFRLAMLDTQGRSREVGALLAELAAADGAEDSPLDRQLADWQREQQRFEALAARIRARIADGSAPPSAPRDLALVLHRLQRWPEAEALYRAQLRHEPDELTLRANLARLLVSDGRADEALAVLEDAPSPSSLDCLRGRVELVHRRDAAGATRAFEACRAAGGRPAAPDLEALATLRAGDRDPSAGLAQHR